ncbi:MAG TPA: divalent metal cation transporter [Gallionella sp.]|nr:divalent metal cation transporter [Gallionella sp.]
MTKLLPNWFKRLGPGLITGAADDDPSGIATYSQGGAQFGFGTLWTLFLTFPLMVAIQVISARIGCVTGKGLAANLVHFYPRRVAFTLVMLLLAANTINIAADLAAMAESVHLATGWPSHIFAVAFGVTCLLLQIFIPYKRYVRVLKWLTLSLFAYVGTVFASHVPWGEVARGVLVPDFEFSQHYLLVIVAIFGTTISPYLFFWQAGQEVEEMKTRGIHAPLCEVPRSGHLHLRRIKADTLVGMTISQVVAFFIMLTTAVTLYSHGVHDIQTSTQAAEALRPIGGEFTFLLFAAGIVGTGMLAVPVLAGSAAYAVADLFHWSSSLGLEFRAAKGFYAIIAFATLCGVLFDFTAVDPVKALIWSAAINGVVAVPLMAAMIYIAMQQKVMSKFVISTRLRWAAWLATAAMAFAAVSFGVVSLISPA